MREDIIHFYTAQTKAPFYLEMAGVSYCDETYELSRKDSKETVLEYVVKGKGYISIDGKNYTASAGQVYILRQKTNHKYWTDAKDPWVKIFFNIRGSLSERILDEYKLGTRGSVVLRGDGLERDFRNMLDRLSDSSINQSERFEQAAVDYLEIIIKLSKLNRGNVKSGLMGDEDEMNQLVEYIAMNPKRIVSNQELANMIYRSKDFVIKRFHSSFGVTPYEYQIQQKMILASNLLQESDLSVK